MLHDNTEFPHVPLYHIPTSTVRHWAKEGRLNSKGGMSFNQIMAALEEL